jgi:hypothetical protein
MNFSLSEAQVSQTALGLGSWLPSPLLFLIHLTFSHCQVDGRDGQDGNISRDWNKKIARSLGINRREVHTPYTALSLHHALEKMAQIGKDARN